jgi:hypothetical protein
VPANAITEAVVEERLRQPARQRIVRGRSGTVSNVQPARYAPVKSREELSACRSRLEKPWRPCSNGACETVTTAGSSSLALLLAPPSLFAADTNAVNLAAEFERANKLYEQGKYGSDGRV